VEVTTPEMYQETEITGQASEYVHDYLRMQCVRTIWFGHHCHAMLMIISHCVARMPATLQKWCRFEFSEANFGFYEADPENVTQESEQA
jgi:hypothetical protein